MDTLKDETGFYNTSRKRLIVEQFNKKNPPGMYKGQKVFPNITFGDGVLARVKFEFQGIDHYALSNWAAPYLIVIGYSKFLEIDLLKIDNNGR